MQRSCQRMVFRKALPRRITGYSEGKKRNCRKEYKKKEERDSKGPEERTKNKEEKD